MNRIIQFFQKYSFFLLFLFLETIALSIMVSSSNYHKVKFLNSSNGIYASLYSAITYVEETFSLRIINVEQAEQIAKLSERLTHFTQENLRLESQLRAKLIVDSLKLDSISESYTLDESRLIVGTSSSDSLNIGEKADISVFRYRSAKVVKNSVGMLNNSIIIDKGEVDGVEVDMAVVSEGAVVGVVAYVSKNYSKVISLLSTKLIVSAKLQNSNFAGIVQWDGLDGSVVPLKNISYHVDIAEGDTIVTSGFASIFPDGVEIGVVKSFSNSVDGNFFDVEVSTAVDFNSLYFVDIIENIDQDEINELYIEDNGN